MQLSNDVLSHLAGRPQNRRSALRAGLLAMEALGCAALLGGAAACSGEVAEGVEQGAMVGVLLGLVIPQGETSGAGNQGNVEFVLRAVDAGLMGTPRDTLARLAQALDGEVPGLFATGGFMDQSQARQAAILGEYDRKVFAAPIAFPSPWFTAKALILMAYYTSEAGASGQLDYEIAPGRYDRDVPVTPAFRPLSNDYSANSIKKKIAG
ncbi:gluconate 2-dehydrogenase subunit 3 family protein [Novosphingobium resinovorum]|nr:MULTISPECIES: gluconate 2-dehydrogenase subunit 3 family protein [Sphingomonadaceae]MBF7014501.1 gluconate 2-dehydrogenase subunit 3 family protein [Novosphingobium sp. HR1a]WJM25018.1 gluconate 2-dehydrogenase subunit 3 family protein [Novosphingobium resinovorum]